MKTTSLLVVSLFVYLGLGAISYAVQVLDPGYKAELYVSYSAAPGWSRDMVFDSDGNLYIANQANNSITKITPDKQVNTSWVTGLNNPYGIEYTGGTSYGNNLYVACVGSNKVVKVDMTGNKTDFCSLTGVSAISYDRTGQYGNKLYVGTSAEDRIYSVSATGSATTFSNSFYNLGGSIQGIGFANSAAYGYAMYAGTWYPNNLDKSGIFKIPTSGIAQRVCNDLEDLVSGFTVNYDEMGLLGGDLFAYISERGGSIGGLYRISPEGIASFFVNGMGSTTFTFGNDGAMYLQHWTSQASEIWRITPIPEPMTLLLLGLGFLGLRRRK